MQGNAAQGPVERAGGLAPRVPPGTRSFVAWTLRHGALLWCLALLVAVPAAIRTATLYRNLKSDLEELLPRESPSVRALDEMRRRLPGLQYLGVVVDVGRPENLAAGERFLDDLATRIRAYPPQMVREVRTGSEQERKLVLAHAPLYVELGDLREVLRRIETRRDYEVEKESGSLLDESEPPPPLDVSDFEKKYEGRISDKKSESGRFSDADQHLTLLFVEAGEFTTGADKARALLGRVQADARALGGPAAYAPGMRIGYSSDVAISVEELDALEADLSVSSVIVFALEIAVIVLYYRWWRSVAVLFPPLLLATVYAFGIASLPPANVRDLNSNTAFLGSIIVGNGINVGIVLLARYREARRQGASVEEALCVGVWGARVGTLAAAFAAAASYASLLLTEFRGFRQFGYIGGAGMVASWVTAFVLIPPLVRWLDRDDTAVLRAAPERLGIMGRIARQVERAPLPIVVAALAITAVCAYTVSRFDVTTQLEHDFSRLRRVDTWASGDGYWGRKVDTLLGRYVTPTVVLADTAEGAVAAEKAIRASVEHGVLGPMVASVRGADDVLPPDQQAKVDVARDIREALTPKIRSLIDADRLRKLDRLLGAEDLAPLRADDLPHSFTAGLQERDGTMGRTVLVYPRPSDTLWRAKEIHAFVGELRRAGGRVAGSIPLSDDIIASISRDAPVASLASFVAVVAIVLVVLRGRRPAIYVIGALAVGVLWMAGAAMLLGIKVNFCNFVAYPITFGIGVDYAVNVITRFVQDGERDVTGAVRSTGAAVGLCSLTTIIGYSSLLLAKNRALYLFGLTAVLGEVACLAAAVLALPALLVALRGERGPLAKRTAIVRQNGHEAPRADAAGYDDSSRMRGRDAAPASSGAPGAAPSDR
jgi:predicted RND superfamily exporter protein